MAEDFDIEISTELSAMAGTPEEFLPKDLLTEIQNLTTLLEEETQRQKELQRDANWAFARVSQEPFAWPKGVKDPMEERGEKRIAEFNESRQQQREARSKIDELRSAAVEQARSRAGEEIAAMGLSSPKALKQVYGAQQGEDEPEWTSQRSQQDENIDLLREGGKASDVARIAVERLQQNLGRTPTPEELKTVIGTPGNTEDAQKEVGRLVDYLMGGRPITVAVTGARPEPGGAAADQREGAVAVAGGEGSSVFGAALGGAIGGLIGGSISQFVATAAKMATGPIAAAAGMLSTIAEQGYEAANVHMEWAEQTRHIQTGGRGIGAIFGNRPRMSGHYTQDEIEQARQQLGKDFPKNDENNQVSESGLGFYGRMMHGFIEQETGRKFQKPPEVPGEDYRVQLEKELRVKVEKKHDEAMAALNPPDKDDDILAQAKDVLGPVIYILPPPFATV